MARRDPLRRLHSTVFVLLASLSSAAVRVLGRDMESGGVTTTSGPQPCPVNPIQLVASLTPQYIHSPYDVKSHLYLPNSDCKFLLRASDKNHRLHLTVLASHLEEPLFQGHCSDYCSLRDADSSAREIVRWCGTGAPTSVTSSTDTLYLHFHSDAVVQRSGFNISFVEFELPGCPPGWYSDPDASSHVVDCFKLVTGDDNDNLDDTAGFAWLEAQRQCGYERANLATFHGPNEYESVLDAYASASASPWIGYSDAFGLEGSAFKTADNTTTLWPEDFPTFTFNTDDDESKQRHGCLYLDWALRGSGGGEQSEATAYAIDDCWQRRAFICRKRRDGSTIPVHFSQGLMRSSTSSTSSVNLSLLFVLLIVLLAIILLLLLLWFCYRQYKRRKANRVANVDQNQRLVSGLPPPAPATVQPPQAATISEPRRSTERSGGATKLDDLTAITRGNWTATSAHPAPKIPLADTDEQHFTSAVHTLNHQEQTRKEKRAKDEHFEEEEYAMESPRISMTPNQPGAYATASHGAVDHTAMNHQHHLVVVSREETMNGSAQSATEMAASTSGWVKKLRRRREFERPHVKTLESVSAISLDEFWQQR